MGAFSVSPGEDNSFGFSIADSTLRWMDFNIPLHRTAQLKGQFSADAWSTVVTWLAITASTTAVYILIQVRGLPRLYSNPSVNSASSATWVACARCGVALYIPLM